jgi:hypothetical protein
MKAAGLLPNKSLQEHLEGGFGCNNGDVDRKQNHESGTDY